MKYTFCGHICTSLLPVFVFLIYFYYISLPSSYASVLFIFISKWTSNIQRQNIHIVKTHQAVVCNPASCARKFLLSAAKYLVVHGNLRLLAATTIVYCCVLHLHFDSNFVNYIICGWFSLYRIQPTKHPCCNKRSPASFAKLILHESLFASLDEVAL